MTTERRWLRGMPLIVFLLVFTGHAFFIRYQAAVPADGWADVGVGYGGLWGFAAYITEQDYYLGFSYGLGAAFATWSANQFIRTRQAAMAAGAVGSVTFVGVLMATGCFLIGCCGSPMLGVYLGLFGAKALGFGKPLMALVTVLSVGWGYWYLSRRAARGRCTGTDCTCSKTAS
jgi:hypothetical protein